MTKTILSVQSILLAAVVWICGATVSAQDAPTTYEQAINDPRAEKLAKPTPSQAQWHDTEFGMFVHYGLYSWPGGVTDKPKREYMDKFDPTELDTDQWVRTAQAMGANYIVFTAKHGDGFCMWQTDTSEYSIKNTPWQNGKGDIVADLSESCRKAGMKLGLYIQGMDQWQGAGHSGKCPTPEAQEKYNAIYRKQLTEVLSKYGTKFEIWFDGGMVVPVEDILAEYAPKANVFQGKHTTMRWVGHEEGFAPYPAWNALKRADAETGTATAHQGDPDGDVWLGLECDARMRASWMYEANNAHTLKSVDYLMDMYCRSVGHGAVLLLNHTPDTTGLIPATDVKRAQEFGDEIRRRFGNPIGKTSGFGTTVALDFDSPKTISDVITMEEIRHGERVRQYVIEGKIGGKWQKLAEGTSIGHKKIDKIEPVKVSAVRIRVLQSAATPLIRELSAHHAGDAVNE